SKRRKCSARGGIAIPHLHRRDEGQIKGTVVQYGGGLWENETIKEFSRESAAGIDVGCQKWGCRVACGNDRSVRGNGQAAVKNRRNRSSLEDADCQMEREIEKSRVIPGGYRRARQRLQGGQRKIACLCLSRIVASLRQSQLRSGRNPQLKRGR